MKKNKLKRFNKSLSGIFLLATLVAPLISSTFPPSVSADVPPLLAAGGFNPDAEVKPTQVEDVLLLEALVKCNVGAGSTPAQLSQSQVDSLNIFSDPTAIVSVGPALDNGPDGDEQFSCREVAAKAAPAIKNLFGSNKAYVENFYIYEETSPGAGQPGRTYYARTDPPQTMFQLYRDKPVFSSYLLENIDLAFYFAKCYDEDGTTGDYKLLDSATPDTLVMNGGSAATQLTCQQVFDSFNFSNFGDEYGGFTTGRLRNSPSTLFDAIKNKALNEEARADAAQKLLNIFTITPGPLGECWANAGLTFRMDQGQDAADLLAGVISDIDGNPDQTTVEDSLTDCIKEKYGAFVTNILDDLDDTIEGNEPIDDASSDSPTAKDDTDKCLEGDSILGWVVCPMLGAIQSALEKIENNVQELLKFDLANAQGKGKKGGTDKTGAETLVEIRDSWNTFRALASILIIVGFLTALTVKAVKGE